MAAEKFHGRTLNTFTAQARNHLAAKFCTHRSEWYLYSPTPTVEGGGDTGFPPTVSIIYCANNYGPVAVVFEKLNSEWRVTYTMKMSTKPIILFMEGRTMKQIDRQLMKQLRVEIDEALAAVGKKHDLTIVMKNAKFDHLGFTSKIEGSVIDDSGVVLNPEVVAFQNMATYFGLKPTDIGRKFTHKGKVYELIGLKNGSPKFPFIGRRVSDNQKFKFPESIIKKALIGNSI